MPEQTSILRKTIITKQEKYHCELFGSNIHTQMSFANHIQIEPNNNAFKFVQNWKFNDIINDDGIWQGRTRLEKSMWMSIGVFHHEL